MSHRIKGHQVYSKSILTELFGRTRFLENLLCAQRAQQDFFDIEQPWLVVLLDSFGGQIGPYFSGIDSPCFYCMLKRKESFVEGDSSYRLVRKSFFEKLPEYAEAGPSFPLIEESVMSFAATEVYKLVTDLPSHRIHRGGFLVDGLNIKIKFNELFPIPFCPVCSGINHNPLGAIVSRGEK